jgi:nucleosome binding factor SPN SPT16 subunit
LSEEKENSAQETNLQLIKGKRPILQDLKVRPNISGKKTSGTLEAHQNGFRYISNKNERIDILFANVKHAFFQPCDGDMIILLHVHLYSGVMVGKKKKNDVQFYTEAGIQTEDLGIYIQKCCNIYFINHFRYKTSQLELSR